MGEEQEVEDAGAVGTVAERILTAAFDQMAAEEGLVEVTLRLRKLVLDDRVFADPALRAAMFADEL